MESLLELLFARQWPIKKVPHVLIGVPFAAPPVHSRRWGCADWAASSTSAYIDFRRRLGLTWQPQQRLALPGLGSQPVSPSARGSIQVVFSKETSLCLGQPTPLFFKSSVDVAFMHQTAEELNAES